MKIYYNLLEIFKIYKKVDAFPGHRSAGYTSQRSYKTFAGCSQLCSPSPGDQGSHKEAHGTNENSRAGLPGFRESAASQLDVPLHGGKSSFGLLL